MNHERPDHWCLGCGAETEPGIDSCGCLDRDSHADLETCWIDEKYDEESHRPKMILGYEPADMAGLFYSS